MTWRFSYPLLYFLPISIGLILHIFLSAGLLSRTRQGFYRYSLYILSACFIIAYMLIFNHGITLAGTKVRLDYQSRAIILNNQYGTVNIPARSVYAVMIEGGEGGAVWVFSAEQSFYLDRRFTEFSAFFPSLKDFIPLGEPVRRGREIIYLSRLQAGQGVDLEYPEVSLKDNKLQGKIKYHLPWLFMAPIILFPAGQRAWMGRTKFFIIFFGVYLIPLLALAPFCPPPLGTVLFLILYPFYMLFLNAMCLPDK